MDDIRSLGTLGRAWAVGILLFSIARALVTWPALGDYGVNPWVFLLIDIVTAIPYGLGQAITVKILRDQGRPPRQAVPWALIVTAAFLAPYLYIFLASGSSLPLLAYVGVGAWMLVFGVLAVLRIHRQVRAPLPDPAVTTPTGHPDPDGGVHAETGDSPDSRRTP
jgi:hypothetical protein